MYTGKKVKTKMAGSIKYWMRIGQTVYGGNTGYTEAEMLGFIAQQQVLPDTLVSFAEQINITGWTNVTGLIAANQVPALQHALPVNQAPQNQLAYSIVYEEDEKAKRDREFYDGYAGPTNSPWVNRWLAKR